MRRPSAGGGVGELELWFAMAPMAARKSGRRVEDLAVVVDVTSLAELPVGLALPRSVGLSEGVEAAVNLVSHAPAPLLFYIYSAGDRSPPAIWAGHPRSGCVQVARPDLWIRPWRSTPTFSPLISRCSYSCSVSEFGPSHCRSVYRACLAMIVITIRLTTTITFPI